MKIHAKSHVTFAYKIIWRTGWPAKFTVLAYICSFQLRDPENLETKQTSLL